MPPEERDCSQFQLASGDPQASQIPDFQGMPPSRYGCSSRSSENCCLIKRRFYWPRVQKDVETWCKRCTACRHCNATVRGHGELQQPRHGAFNQRFSVNLIGSLHRTESGNEYIVMMQDHFIRWIEGTAIPTKEAMIVAEVIVHEWVYRHDTLINLHSDRGTEFTGVMHHCMCDLLRIHKTYSTVYNPQSNRAVERYNRTLLSILRTVVSEQQNDWDDHLPEILCATCHHGNQPTLYGLRDQDDSSFAFDAGRYWTRAGCP